MNSNAAAWVLISVGFVLIVIGSTCHLPACAYLGGFSIGLAIGWYGRGDR